MPYQSWKLMSLNIWEEKLVSSFLNDTYAS